jgi:hypothetical protein
VFIVSLKVAPDPVRGVHVLNGETDRCQLYVGPDDAGVPVDADVEFVMLTVPPAHIGKPPMAPALCEVE